MRATLTKALVGFTNSVGNLRTIYDLVREPIGSGIDSLELIAKYNIIEMLENPKMREILMTYWKGPYPLLGISDFSSIFSFTEETNISEEKANPFTYKVWEHSVFAGRSIHGFFILIIAILIQVSSRDNLQTELEIFHQGTKAETHIAELIEFLSTSLWICYLNIIIFFGFFIREVAEVKYAASGNRKVSLFSSPQVYLEIAGMILST